jgi:hypothetical protein
MLNEPEANNQGFRRKTPFKFRKIETGVFRGD